MNATLLDYEVYCIKYYKDELALEIASTKKNMLSLELGNTQ